MLNLFVAIISLPIHEHSISSPVFVGTSLMSLNQVLSPPPFEFKAFEAITFFPLNTALISSHKCYVFIFILIQFIMFSYFCYDYLTQ